MESKPAQEFYAFKKLVIFGGAKTGKASFTKRLESGTFTDLSDDGNDRSKFIFYILLSYLNYQLFLLAEL